MKNELSLLESMKNTPHHFSKSDKKVASIVLTDPKKIIHTSIAKLAKMSQVSEPTVNRFCHKIGCNGYPEFKLKLAQEIKVKEYLFMERIEVRKGDASGQVIQHVLNSIENSVQNLANSLDPQALKLAAKKIAQSDYIHFFGMGASSSVAMDAQHKFFRFGIPTSAQIDYINQKMMCSIVKKNHISIFISYTGRTKDIIENAHIAKRNHSTNIGITSEKSPLAEQCDIILNTSILENTDYFTPMTSRITQLAIIDMLASSVALILGKKIDANIASIKTNLTSTRTS